MTQQAVRFKRLVAPSITVDRDLLEVRADGRQCPCHITMHLSTDRPSRPELSAEE